MASSMQGIIPRLVARAYANVEQYDSYEKNGGNIAVSGNGNIKHIPVGTSFLGQIVQKIIFHVQAIFTFMSDEFIKAKSQLVYKTHNELVQYDQGHKATLLLLALCYRENRHMTEDEVKELEKLGVHLPKDNEPNSPLGGRKFAQETQLTLTWGQWFKSFFVTINPTELTENIPKIEATEKV